MHDRHLLEEVGNRVAGRVGPEERRALGERVADRQQHRVLRARLRLQVRRRAQLRRLRVPRGHRLLPAFPLERDRNRRPQRDRVVRLRPPGIFRD